MKSQVFQHIQHIQRASLILIGGTLLINIIGFAKSLAIARYYGTSAIIDAYALSLTPVRLLMGILLTAIEMAIVPKYLELIVKKNQGHAFAVFMTFIYCILGLSTILALLFFLGSSRMASMLAPGFKDDLLNVTESLLRVSTGFFILNLLNKIGLYLFYAHRQFTFFAFAPVIGGLCSLLYIACFHSYGVMVLMYSLFFGMLIQAVVVIWKAQKFVPSPVFLVSPLNSDVRETFKSMSFLLAGASFGHINILIDQIMASTLPAGSIAALHYANKLHTVFTQAFIMVISRAAFPFFSKHVAEHDYEALKAVFVLTIKRTFVVLLPLTFCIIIAGPHIVALLFQRGEFSAQSSSATAGAWIAYTVGLPIQAVGILGAKVLNALQDNKTLMYISVGNIISNIFFNWICMKIWGHIGIALSTSGMYCISTFIILYLLRKRIGESC